MIRAAIIATVLAACQAKVVDLGRDAGADTTTTRDASTCTCRINSCRVTGDCALIAPPLIAEKEHIDVIADILRKTVSAL